MKKLLLVFIVLMCLCMSAFAENFTAGYMIVNPDRNLFSDTAYTDCIGHLEEQSLVYAIHNNGVNGYELQFVVANASGGTDYQKAYICVAEPRVLSAAESAVYMETLKKQGAHTVNNIPLTTVSVNPERVVKDDGFGTIAFDAKGKVSGSGGTNLRKGPGAKDEWGILITLDKGVDLTIIGYVINGVGDKWYKAKEATEGKTGFIKSTYVELVEEEAIVAEGTAEEVLNGGMLMMLGSSVPSLQLSLLTPYVGVRDTLRIKMTVPEGVERPESMRMLFYTDNSNVTIGQTSFYGEGGGQSGSIPFTEGFSLEGISVSGDVFSLMAYDYSVYHFFLVNGNNFNEVYASLNVDIHSETLTGSFDYTGYSLFLGQTMPFACSVTSSGAAIERVTVTVTGNNVEGDPNDRYATKTFENVFSVSSEDCEFIIDATKAPFNVVGDYTINLWAQEGGKNAVKLSTAEVTIREPGSGEFEKGLYTVAPGSVTPVSGYVTSTPTYPIEEIKLMIDGAYYASQSFQNIFSVQLADCGFTMDTTKAPLNQEGEFSMSLWVKVAGRDFVNVSTAIIDVGNVVDGGGLVLQSSNHTVSNPIEIRVELPESADSFASGLRLMMYSDSFSSYNDHWQLIGYKDTLISKNASMKANDYEYKNRTLTYYPRNKGTYRFVLVDGEGYDNHSYNILYGAVTVKVTDGSASFTMNPTAAVANKDNVHFDIYAPGYSKVKLWVDGQTWNTDPEITVTDDVASYDRVFSESGRRSIVFKGLKNGNWEEIAEAQELLVKDQLIIEMGDEYIFRQGQNPAIITATVKSNKEVEMGMSGINYYYPGLTERTVTGDKTVYKIYAITSNLCSVTTPLISFFQQSDGAYASKSFSFKVIPTINRIEIEKKDELSGTAILLGSELQLSATYLPAEASSEDVYWEVSDPKKASITETGLLTTKAGGDVTVTAYAKDANGNINRNVKDSVKINIGKIGKLQITSHTASNIYNFSPNTTVQVKCPGAESYIIRIAMIDEEPSNENSSQGNSNNLYGGKQFEVSENKTGIGITYTLSDDKQTLSLLIKEDMFQKAFIKIGFQAKRGWWVGDKDESNWQWVGFTALSTKQNNNDSETINQPLVVKKNIQYTESNEYKNIAQGISNGMDLSFSEFSALVDDTRPDTWDKKGKIRYIQQYFGGSQSYYKSKYWYTDKAIHNCDRATAYMGLSYLGIDALPTEKDSRSDGNSIKPVGNKYNLEVKEIENENDFIAAYNSFANDMQYKYSPIMAYVPWNHGGTDYHSWIIVGRCEDDPEQFWIVDPGANNYIAKVKLREVDGELRVVEAQYSYGNKNINWHIAKDGDTPYYSVNLKGTYGVKFYQYIIPDDQLPANNGHNNNEQNEGTEDNTSVGTSSLPLEIYEEQKGGTDCTLTAALMMFRSKVYLNDEEKWADITYDDFKKDNWSSSGLSYTPVYENKEISLSGKTESVKGLNSEKLKELLESHPEGVVIYDHHYRDNSKGEPWPHAVFITDYENGVFYCADPAKGGGRIPLTDSVLGNDQDTILEKIDQIWYITSYENKSKVNEPEAPQIENETMDTSSPAFIDTAIEIIKGNEGGYTTVNANDTGSLAIGKMQWNAGRGKGILQGIARNNKDQAVEILGQTLYEDVMSTTSWSGKKLSDDEAEKISKLLGTEAGIKVQDEQAKIDVEDYIKGATNLKISDPGVLLYYADCANLGVGHARRVAEAAIQAAGGDPAKVTLDIFDAAVRADRIIGDDVKWVLEEKYKKYHYSTTMYVNRHNKVMEKIHGLGLQ